MDYKYLRLVPLISAISLGGCKLTEEDREKLDKAGDNLEKVALAPAITSPGENATIFDLTDIRIGTDTTVPHASVTLLIDGQVISTDTEAPFEFNWDPYFWSKDKQGNLSEEEQIAAQVATISVTALTEGGAFLRSDVRNIKLSETLKDSLEFTAPAPNQAFQNTNQINIAWTPRTGAVNYEYQVNNEQVVSTVSTNATLTLENTGSYQLRVRATNDLGFTGAWSTPRTFNINTPNAPSLNNPVASKNDDGWQASFSWDGSLVSSELQIATDQNFNSVVDTLPTDALNITEELPAGTYYAHVRTTNEFGHVSDWSVVREIAVGLFSHKIDLASSGYWNEDQSVDFVLNDTDAVILHLYSDLGDNSADNFNVTKVGFDGKAIWKKYYGSFMGSAIAINQSSKGYLLTGYSINTSADQIIFEINESGSKLWQANIPHYQGVEPYDYSREYVSDIVELSENRYAYLHETKIYTNYPLIDREKSIKILDRASGSEVLTSIEISNPETGTYDTLNKLLITDSGLFAAGSFTANNDNGSDNSADGFIPPDNDSGAFLLTLDKSDGSITSQTTGTGISSSSVSELIELTGGDITVSYSHYQKAAITTFAVNSDTSIRQLDNGITRAKVAADNNDGYFLVGEGRNNGYIPIISHYTSDNQIIGTSHTFNLCFNDLRVESIKYHPDYGLIVLGSDRYSSGSSSYTVLFNMTDEFEYLCPTTKN